MIRSVGVGTFATLRISHSRSTDTGEDDGRGAAHGTEEGRVDGAESFGHGERCERGERSCDRGSVMGRTGVSDR
jgi:hypothetical protein